MNALQIMQRVAQESGTLSGAVPTTMLAQTGRLKNVVDWTVEAWDQIQSEHATWKWLRDEFESSLLLNTVRYTPASLDITRHREWITDRTHDNGAFTIYDPDTGVSDETVLAWMEWEAFRATYLRGSQTAARPIVCTISPAGEFCVNKPDQTYTVQGEYWKSNQTLAANGDEPECPADYHMAIVWRALRLLKVFDEDAVQTKQDIDRLHDEAMFALRTNQLPRPGIGVRAPALDQT